MEDHYRYLLFKVNIVMMIVFLLVAVVLAGFFPVGLEDPADPTDNLYVPKPEWYFMFFYQLLKYFPGQLEPMVATVVSIGGCLVLLLLPYLDRTSQKRPRQRPIAMAVMVCVVCAVITLTLLGLAS